jgi:hypothetical protein
MAPTPSIKVVKTGYFRGASGHKWANRYHFNGGTPADSAHWTTLSDNIVNAEKLCLHDSQQIVQTIGYAAGSDVPVFTKTYTQNGSLTSDASNVRTPLEVAALIRYATTARTSKNHPIYLFNYMHGPLLQLSGEGDILAPTTKTAMETYATAWIAGFSDGVNTYNRAGPNGASAISRLVSTYLTHRDFRR